eukprot:gene15467-biopygen9246
MLRDRDRKRPGAVHNQSSWGSTAAPQLCEWLCLRGGWTHRADTDRADAGGTLRAGSRRAPLRRAAATGAGPRSLSAREAEARADRGRDASGDRTPFPFLQRLTDLAGISGSLADPDPGTWVGLVPEGYRPPPKEGSLSQTTSIPGALWLNGFDIQPCLLKSA